MTDKPRKCHLLFNSLQLVKLYSVPFTVNLFFAKQILLCNVLKTGYLLITEMYFLNIFLNTEGQLGTELFLQLCAYFVQSLKLKNIFILNSSLLDR